MGITFSGKTLYQSKYLYLQAAGSTGNDGSLEGIHLRWDLLGELGNTHIPKGTLEKTSTDGFNKDNDFVYIYRSRYIQKYPVTLDFSTAKPSKVIDKNSLLSFKGRQWTFKPNTINTNDTVYVVFHDKNRYDSITVDAKTNPIGFLQAYGDGLIEISVKGKLCFATEIFVNNFGTNPELKVEAISSTVDEGNVVSCRKAFDISELGSPTPTPTFLAQENDGLILQENLFRIYLEQSSIINNLLSNGNFENSIENFETEYTTPLSNDSGQYQIVENAQTINTNWAGTPVSGTKFMGISGSSAVDTVVWRQANIAVSNNTTYMFSGWLANLLNCDPLEIPEIEIRIKGVQSQTTKTVQYKAPVMQGKWSYMESNWQSGNNTQATIEIVNKSTTTSGNKFGLDNLLFTEASIKDYGRIVSENIKNVRFKASDCCLCKVNLETYDNYITNVNILEGWKPLGEFGLSTDNTTVLPQLEKTSGTIHNKWPKYKGAKVNVNNYIKRWEPTIENPYNGLKNGVSEYIRLSHDGSNIKATVDAVADPSGSTGTGSGDGTIKTSYFDMLRMVSLDYHIARMLGLGYVDDGVEINPNSEYIYVAQYKTYNSDILLPESILNSELNHIYATPPIKKMFENLPTKPTLLPLDYGLILNRGASNEINLTDADGYTFDGKSRYINLFLTPDNDDAEDTGDFFVPATEFSSLRETDGIFVGVDYRNDGDKTWSKDVITPDEYYMDASGIYKEVCPLPFPSKSSGFLFQHKEIHPGKHDYVAYSINWFSRPSEYSNYQQTNETIFPKRNTLLPPINIKAQLIQEEDPRFLTTNTEQDILKAFSGSVDKTLIRLTFDYSQAHDSTYEYGDKIEFFFRTDAPASVAGQIARVDLKYNGDETLSAIHTEIYTYVDIYKKNVSFNPQVSIQDADRYIGGAFSIKNKTFVIEDVLQPTISTEGATFIVRNIEINTISNTNADTLATPEYETVHSFENPSLYVKEAFTAIENMSNPANWKIGSGAANPLTCVVQIPGSDWEVRDEKVVPNVWNNTTEENVPGSILSDDFYTQKVRGVWDTATIIQKPQLVPNANNPEEPLSENIGVYEITFDLKEFSEHPQSKQSNPVFWNKGIIRINTSGDPYGVKKSLEVLNILSTGTEKIKLLVYDSEYIKPTSSGLPQATNIPEGNGITVNYYPGYKVYLYADSANGLTETNILPAKDTKSKVTYIGARTIDTSYGFASKVSIPNTIIALEIVEPLAPEKPQGGLFATRPDFYNKATYSFRMKFKHEPYAVAFYRASERMILEALYETQTIKTILNDLAALGDDAFFTSRWQSLVAFEYDASGDFKTFPSDTGYKFPTPDKQKDLYGRDLFVDPTKKPFDYDDDIKAAIYNAFLPLTEQPLLYKFIKTDSAYVPTNKKQTIRDAAGDLLDSADSEFDQAPMAKVTGGSDYEMLFTDFTLDGSSNNFYFYCGIELSNRMQFSDYGSILGPIQLVNTSAPESPKVKKVTTQILDEINGVPTAVIIDVSNFLPYQKITKFNLYRSIVANDAISVRNMTLVKELDLETDGLLDTDTISIIDDFANDTFLPYGEPLFYRVVALRKIKYADRDSNIVTDYVPSQPSKTALASIIDTINPVAPVLTFSSDALDETTKTLQHCKLSWDKVTHNATYYVYKMSASGNWNLLDSFKNNLNHVEYLIKDPLLKKDEDGFDIYHRFKVDVENSSGMFNAIENAITV